MYVHVCMYVSHSLEYNKLLPHLHIATFNSVVYCWLLAFVQLISTTNWQKLYKSGFDML